MSYSVIKVDLHGVKHEDVRRILIAVIEDNWRDPFPDIVIITGHSSRMREIVIEIANDYKLNIGDSINDACMTLML